MQCITTGGTIGNVPTLLDLDLSHNQLKDVSRSAFGRLFSIRSLHLQNNNLSSIFQLPISLNELNLANNLIEKIPANRVWPVMNALLSLNLSNNQLGDQLERGSFANLITLQTLDLSSNDISAVPWESLADLPSVQHIYLDFNNITELGHSAFGRLPVVFQLGLSHNAINNISPKAFEGLLQLLHLNLSFNSINFIPPGAFHGINTQLNSYFQVGFGLYVLDPFVVSSGLVSLRVLDLSHNSLERLDNKTHTLLEDCLSLERVIYFLIDSSLRSP